MPISGHTGGGLVVRVLYFYANDISLSSVEV